MFVKVHWSLDCDISLPRIRINMDGYSTWKIMTSFIGIFNQQREEKKNDQFCSKMNMIVMLIFHDDFGLGCLLIIQISNNFTPIKTSKKKCKNKNLLSI